KRAPDGGLLLDDALEVAREPVRVLVAAPVERDAVPLAARAELEAPVRADLEGRVHERVVVLGVISPRPQGERNVDAPPARHVADGERRGRVLVAVRVDDAA